MVFPKIKRAEITFGQLDGKGTKIRRGVSFADLFIERRSRAAWARALANEIKGLSSDPLQFVDALERLHKELLRQAEKDEK